MSSMNIRRDDAFAAGTTSESSTSAVAWSAIVGGAVAAASVSLILLLLGSALGLSSMSPWSYSKTSMHEAVSSFTIKTAIWLIVMQWVASGLGGYLTGRLRTKWSGLHTDEVFFRDTAHGFLAWAAATILTASVLASATSSVVSGGMKAATTVASGAAMGAAANTDTSNNPNGYYIDSLFRSTTPNPSASSADANAEAGRIIANGVKNGTLTDNDKAYLSQLIAARTGISQQEAQARVDDTMNQLNAAKEKAKQDAEAARKTAMHVSIYLFISMLIGAFVASAAAAIGGRHRDEY